MLMNTEQLDLFGQPNPTSSTASPVQPLQECLDCGFTIGDRIQIVKAGPPFENRNGQTGKVVGLGPDAVSVQLEGVAIALIFRPEALKQWAPINDQIGTRAETESVILLRVGERVECDLAFVGQIGTIQKIGMHCGVTVAWIQYADGKPLYPCSLERLTPAE
jgi:ribosomal protein L21E